MMNVSKLGTLTCYGVTDTTDVCGLVYRAEGANGRIYILSKMGDSSHGLVLGADFGRSTKSRVGF
jgi:hypothetical protein